MRRLNAFILDHQEALPVGADVVVGEKPAVLFKSIREEHPRSRRGEGGLGLQGDGHHLVTAAIEELAVSGPYRLVPAFGRDLPFSSRTGKRLHVHFRPPRPVRDVGEALARTTSFPATPGVKPVSGSTAKRQRREADAQEHERGGLRNERLGARAEIPEELVIDCPGFVADLDPVELIAAPDAHEGEHVIGHAEQVGADRNQPIQQRDLERGIKTGRVAPIWEPERQGRFVKIETKGIQRCGRSDVDVLDTIDRQIEILADERTPVDAGVHRRRGHISERQNSSGIAVLGNRPDQRCAGSELEARSIVEQYGRGPGCGGEESREQDQKAERGPNPNAMCSHGEKLCENRAAALDL